MFYVFEEIKMAMVSHIRSNVSDGVSLSP